MVWKALIWKIVAAIVVVGGLTTGGYYIGHKSAPKQSGDETVTGQLANAGDEPGGGVKVVARREVPEEEGGPKSETAKKAAIQEQREVLIRQKQEKARELFDHLEVQFDFLDQGFPRQEISVIPGKWFYVSLKVTNLGDEPLSDLRLSLGGDIQHVTVPVWTITGWAYDEQLLQKMFALKRHELVNQGVLLCRIQDKYPRDSVSTVLNPHNDSHYSAESKEFEELIWVWTRREWPRELPSESSFGSPNIYALEPPFRTYIKSQKLALTKNAPLGKDLTITVYICVKGYRFSVGDRTIHVMHPD